MLQLKEDMDDQRRKIRLEIDWAAAVQAGLVAGTVFLALALITGLIFDSKTLLGPAHIIYQGIVEGDVEPSRAHFGLAFAVFIVHFVLSILLTLVLIQILYQRRTVVQRWGTAVIVAAGAVFGAVLYGINFYVFSLAWPALALGRSFVMLVDYVLFGIVAAWFYTVATRRSAQHA